MIPAYVYIPSVPVVSVPGPFAADQLNVAICLAAVVFAVAAAFVGWRWVKREMALDASHTDHSAGVPSNKPDGG